MKQNATCPADSVGKGFLLLFSQPSFSLSPSFCYFFLFPFFPSLCAKKSIREMNVFFSGRNGSGRRRRRRTYNCLPSFTRILRSKRESLFFPRIPTFAPPPYIPTRLESYLPGNESAYGSGSNVITTFSYKKENIFFFL